MWPFKPKQIPLAEAVLKRPSFVEGFQPALNKVKEDNARLDKEHEEIRNLRYNNAVVIMDMIRKQYPDVKMEIKENSIHRVVGPSVKILITKPDGHASCFHIYSFSDSEDSKNQLRAIASFLEG